MILNHEFEMTLQIHNTLTGKKEEFKPIDLKHIRMYVCGPTVYDYAHIGNARPVVVFDVLYRLLKEIYPDSKATYVRNITDIDDKIIEASRKTGEPIGEITKRTAEAYFEDMGALNALVPDECPKATDYIEKMIEMIQSLVEKGHAYEAEGHVLFDVPSMKDYGGLSKLDQEQLIAGARVEKAPYKKDASDFVLWKPSSDDQPGWESPWGRGRPGWHIECSAMAKDTLGDEFDIHGGGQDLIFPHHENEIAQSRCAHGTKLMAKYWMHNGYLTMSGEKMSKSIGNIITVHELLKDHQGEVIRYALLSAHYRQPLDFSDDLLVQSKQCLDRLYRGLEGEIVESDAPLEILKALEDDLNTPKAYSVIFAILSEINKEGDDTKKAVLRGKLKAAGALLGILQQDPNAWFQSKSEDGLSDDKIQALLDERQQARANKDFARSDEIRDTLKEKGIVIEDSATGAKWRYE